MPDHDQPLEPNAPKGLDLIKFRTQKMNAIHEASASDTKGRLKRSRSSGSRRDV